MILVVVVVVLAMLAHTHTDKSPESCLYEQILLLNGI